MDGAKDERLIPDKEKESLRERHIFSFVGGRGDSLLTNNNDKV